MKRSWLFVFLLAFTITSLPWTPEAVGDSPKSSAKNKRKPPKYVKKYPKGKPGKLTKDQEKRKKEREKKEKKGKVRTSVGNLGKIDLGRPKPPKRR